MIITEGFNTLNVGMVPVGPKPGWIEGGDPWRWTDPEKWHEKLHYKGPDLVIYRHTIVATDWEYCANRVEIEERWIEQMGVDTTGCYGNREACVGRRGVIYIAGLMKYETIVTGAVPDGYCVRHTETALGVDTPEAQAILKAALPTDYPIILYTRLMPTSVLTQLENLGAADITHVSPINRDTWVKLKIYDVDKFISVLASNVFEFVHAYFIDWE